eukprot:2601107-Rhodomonas_salina.2
MHRIAYIAAYARSVPHTAQIAALRRQIAASATGIARSTRVGSWDPTLGQYRAARREAVGS